MVNNRIRGSQEGNPPVDEAWWSALLADEERYSAARSDGSTDGEGDGLGEINPGDKSRTPRVDWEQIEQLFARDETIPLNVSGFNRGGLLVDGEDIHGFVPVSHLVDISGELEGDEKEQVLEGYIGKTLYLKVIECEPTRGRVVFSERAALASTGRRNQLLRELTPGDCIQGIVTNITDFGVFVDLGGVEGLVHVSEISWGRVRHPTDAVEVGQRVTAYVIQIDKERTRIALSLKRLCDNPWEHADERYQPGQVVQAVVTSVVPFGAFARLEEGLDGLIHITEMSESGSVPPEQIVEEGQNVTARVLHIDALRQRLGLSLLLNE